MKTNYSINNNNVFESSTNFTNQKEFNMRTKNTDTTTLRTIHIQDCTFDTIIEKSSEGGVTKIYINLFDNFYRLAEIEYIWLSEQYIIRECNGTKWRICASTMYRMPDQ